MISAVKRVLRNTLVKVGIPEEKIGWDARGEQTLITRRASLSIASLASDPGRFEAAISVTGPFIDKIGALAARFAELDPAQQKNIVKILGVAATAGPAALVLGGLSRGIGCVLSVTKTITPMLGGLVRGIGGVVRMALKSIPSLLSFAVPNSAALYISAAGSFRTPL